MITLGIETSCDETAAAVLRDEKLLSSAVSSSVHLHRKFGGIVPEIASRFHLEFINPVLDKALKQAKIKLTDVDLVAVTSAPGLVGSLLVGLSFAKGLSFGLNKPFIGVNHIHAHLLSAFVGEKRPPFPFIGTAVSGGHTLIALVEDFHRIKTLGKTRDDAAGEAFDKAAKLLGLPYPGGPELEKLAARVKESPVRLTCARLEDSLDFSFSGIKTAVLYKAREMSSSPTDRARIAHSFQKAVVDVIAQKSVQACVQRGIKTLAGGGGVVCNGPLRERLKELTAEYGIDLKLAPMSFCGDNAAMIGYLGYNLFLRGKQSRYDLTPKATSRL